VLLFLLRSYYAGLELRYLEQNAESISLALMDLFQPAAATMPAAERDELLQSQLNSFSYLTETKIELFDGEGRLIAASGNPQDLQAVATLSLEVQTGEAVQSFSQTLDGGDDYSTVLIIESGGARYVTHRSVSGGTAELSGESANLLPVDTPERFLLGTEPGQEARSTLVYRQEIPGPIIEPGADSAGNIELSQGPAFGGPVLQSVLWGLIIAGAIAVVLATFAGWLISLRLSRPILELTAVTGQMAAGDLSVRAPSNRWDELGLLAGSFNSMAARVEATVMALRRFVADAAHELNTPLTALRTNLDLAEGGASGNRYLLLAQKQALRLQKLNDDLLRLSHLDSGLNVVAFEPVDLCALIGEQNERYAAQAEQGELAYEGSWPNAPLMVARHREYLLRALDNLVDNAIKFTPPGGQITVELNERKQWAAITVTDTGIGIEENETALVFNRFHRGGNATNYPGSGLGLAIVKTIVDAHGGEISVKSDSAGTRFTLRLPKSQVGELAAY
jgi:signal transduction histidine kinase